MKPQTKEAAVREMKGIDIIECYCKKGNHGQCRGKASTPGTRSPAWQESEGCRVLVEGQILGKESFTATPNKGEKKKE